MRLLSSSSLIDFDDLTLSLARQPDPKTKEKNLRRVPYWVGREKERAGREESDCEEELGDEGAGRGLGDLVWLEQAWVLGCNISRELTVSDSLLDTHACALLVVENTEGEGECTGLLLHLGESSARCLHLELVVDLGALVDSSTRVLGAGLLSANACEPTLPFRQRR